MIAVRRHLRACTWLALLSMAVLVIGPTVSRALLPGDAGRAAFAVIGHAEALATAVGSPAAADPHAHHHHPAAMQAGVGANPRHPPTHSHSLEHCGLCVVAASAFTIAPVPSMVLPVSPGASFEGARAAAAPRLQAHWSPARPRGPPSVA